MRWRSAAAALAFAALVAGCSTTPTSTTSVTAKGHTLAVYLSEPPAGSHDVAAKQVFEAEQLACAQSPQLYHGTAFSLRCIPVQRGKLSANARAAIQNTSSIAYVGEIEPGASEQTVGITNALDLLQISPTDTAVELTNPVSAVPGSPRRYYESPGAYGRTFARISADSAQEASAQVAFMKSLKVRSLYVGNDGSDYGRTIAQAVRRDASGAGIGGAGSAASADAGFYGGSSATAAATFVKGLGAGAKVFLPSALYGSATGLGRSSAVYVSLPGVPRSASERAFERAFRARFGVQPLHAAVFGYVAVAAVMHVVEEAGRNASSRSTIIKDVHSLNAFPSAVGPLSIDKSGDSSLDQGAFVFSEVKRGQLGLVVPRK